MAVPKLTELEWSQIRHAYEAPGANVSALARRYGISRSLIQKQASARGWTKGEPLPSDTDEEQDTVAEARTRPATAGAGATGFELPLQRQVMAAQQREWQQIRSLMRQALQPLQDQRWIPDEPAPAEGSPSPKPLSYAARRAHAEKNLALLKDLVTTTYTKQRGEREAHGIDVRTFSAQAAPEQPEISEEKRLLVEQLKAAVANIRPAHTSQNEERDNAHDAPQ